MNKENKKKLIIKFTEEQTEKYLEITSSRTRAEVDEDCLPSGSTITIDISGVFGSYAKVNGQDIGDIMVKFIDEHGKEI